MTETWRERYERTGAEYRVARAQYRHWYEAEVKRVYADMRAADKAAGRDTSGKSVATRRTIAYDVVMMSDEAHARRDAVDALEAVYVAAKQVAS